MDISSTKKHADFQDRYRRSSNFRRTLPKEKFVLGEDGEVILDKNHKEIKNESNKKKKNNDNKKNLKDRKNL